MLVVKRNTWAFQSTIDQWRSVNGHAAPLLRTKTARRKYTKRISCTPSSQTVSSSSIHPDALRRRREAEERAQQREQMRLKQQEQEEAGIKWWQDSTHILNMASPAELLQVLDQASLDQLTIVCFFTEDCYSCRSLHPKLQSIAAAALKSGVRFVKINGSDPTWQSYCQSSNIETVPYFHFYRSGKRVSGMSASLNPQKLAAFRAEIEMHKGSPVTFGESSA